MHIYGLSINIYTVMYTHLNPGSARDVRDAASVDPTVRSAGDWSQTAGLLTVME